MRGKKIIISNPELRTANINKMRGMGLSYRKIGRIYGTSSIQVQYWLIGRYVEHLTEKPGRCEICGVIYKRLNHHHWDDDDPRIGLWLCPLCHMASEAIDKVPGFASKYHILKEAMELLASNAVQSSRKMIHAKQCKVAHK